MAIFPRIYSQHRFNDKCVSIIWDGNWDAQNWSQYLLSLYVPSKMMQADFKGSSVLASTLQGCWVKWRMKKKNTIMFWISNPKSLFPSWAWIYVHRKQNGNWSCHWDDDIGGSGRGIFSCDFKKTLSPGVQKFLEHFSVKEWHSGTAIMHRCLLGIDLFQNSLLWSNNVLPLKIIKCEVSK